MSDREQQLPRNRDLWRQHADVDDREAGEPEPSPAEMGLRYRFPRTPEGARIDAVDLRFTESMPHHMAFRRLCDRMVKTTDRRVPEAVLTRGLRRFLVRHQDALLEASREVRVRGRTITEEDVFEMLGNVFTLPLAEQERVAS